MEEMFANAANEAKVAFNDPSLFVEKYLDDPKHIEVQIVADAFGHVVHLGERECSIQRKHQKLLEEAPSPAIDEGLRARMGLAAVALAKEVGYQSFGTVEFLLDAQGGFYFMEMNTRIQVEHPITEEVYGCDLIKEQIQIAAGLPLSQHILKSAPRHHSIECRINAEDPARNFAPSPGRIDLWYAPGGRGVRVDTHVYSGYSVPPHYDSMIAKLIVTAATRDAAIRRMRRALGEFMIQGIKTTIPLQAKIITTSDFQNAKYDITWVENFLRQEGMKDKG